MTATPAPTTSVPTPFDTADPHAAPATADPDSARVTASGSRMSPDPYATGRNAGLLYLTIVALGIFAEVAVRGQLIEKGDPAATAANILESQALFRIGFAADLIVFLADVALAIVLFRLLEPISRTLSMLAAAFRLTQAAIIGLNLLDMFNALRILDDADYVGAFDGAQVEALALLHLDSHRYGYTLGLAFFGVSTLLIAHMGWGSRRIPRALAAVLALAGIGYLVDTSMFFMVPGYEGAVSPVVLAPALVGELWFALWLLLRGKTLEQPARI